MSFVVEDGTGLSNANSYASVAEFDNHWRAEGNEAAVDLDADVKESALVSATRDLDRQYWERWIGGKSSDSQSLSWPRSNAIDSDGFDQSGKVPSRLVEATVEMAKVVAIDGANLREVTSESSVIAETVKAGSVQVSTTYANPQTTEGGYAEIDNILSSLLASGRGTVRLTRV